MNIHGKIARYKVDSRKKSPNLVSNYLLIVLASNNTVNFFFLNTKIRLRVNIDLIGGNTDLAVLQTDVLASKGHQKNPLIILVEIVWVNNLNEAQFKFECDSENDSVCVESVQHIFLDQAQNKIAWISRTETVSPFPFHLFILKFPSQVFCLHCYLLMLMSIKLFLRIGSSLDKGLQTRCKKPLFLRTLIFERKRGCIRRETYWVKWCS